VAGCATAGIVARLASDLVLGGQTDWFLPSIDELAEMYTQRINVGGLSLAGFMGSMYFSSSEMTLAPTTNVLIYFMGNFSGSSTNQPKSQTNLYIRPIRAF
jgi:hypothetical protein